MRDGGRGREKARDLLWGIAHMNMEAEESHYLLSASWRPRKASRVIHSKFKSLRTRWADGRNPSQGAREDERRCPRSTVNRGEKGLKFLPVQPFVLSRSWVNWMKATQVEDGNLLNPPIQMLISQTHTEMCLTWAPCHKSSYYIKLTNSRIKFLRVNQRM